MDPCSNDQACNGVIMLYCSCIAFAYGCICIIYCTAIELPKFKLLLIIKIQEQESKATSMALLEVVMGSDRHKHGGILTKAAFIVAGFRRLNHYAAPRPCSTPPPTELNVDSRPCPPV